MTELLIIQNFGPLKNIKISLNRINVFIGETASGKSILSKLASIFTSSKLLKKIDENNFVSVLKHYDIDTYLEDNPYIRFENSNYYIEYKNQKLTTNFPYKINTQTINGFNNIVDCLEEKQRNLYDRVCSNKETFIEYGSTWEEIKKYFTNFCGEISSETKEIINAISEFQNLNAKEGIFATEKELELSFKLYEHLKKYFLHATETIYIPAERAYISTLSNSLFSIISERVALPKCLTDFGAYFEQARRINNKQSLKIFNIEYQFRNNKNIIHLSDYQKELELTQVSSGMQAVIPMLLVLTNIQTKLRIIKNCIVIEEPELNLFPATQKKIIELIIKTLSDNSVNCNSSSHVLLQDKLKQITKKYINKQDRLIITTHSPYVLTTLDSLIQADNAYKEKPDAKNKISKIVDKNKWIDFEDIRAYYLKDGSATDILDYEMKSIGANRIDDISDEIGKTYDNLLNIMFDEK